MKLLKWFCAGIMSLRHPCEAVGFKQEVLYTHVEASEVSEDYARANAEFSVKPALLSECEAKGGDTISYLSKYALGCAKDGDTYTCAYGGSGYCIRTEDDE